MLNYPNFKVDLSNCDKEPIHIIGRIQPHGLLIIIDRQSFSIEQVSSNIADFVPDTEVQQWLGSSIFDFLPPQSESGFEADFLTKGSGIIQLCDRQFYGFGHISGDKTVLECEPYTDPLEQEKLQQLEKLSLLKSQLNQLEDPFTMADVLAKDMQQYLGYDRVNVIRFDRNWNSEVIGESLKGNADAFLGHRFPASDIPQVA